MNIGKARELVTRVSASLCDEDGDLRETEEAIEALLCVLVAIVQRGVVKPYQQAVAANVRERLGRKLDLALEAPRGDSTSN